jgi:hypothetical protein
MTLLIKPYIPYSFTVGRAAAGSAADKAATNVLRSMAMCSDRHLVQ